MKFSCVLCSYESYLLLLYLKIVFEHNFMTLFFVPHRRLLIEHSSCLKQKSFGLFGVTSLLRYLLMFHKDLHFIIMWAVQNLILRMPDVKKNIFVPISTNVFGVVEG